MEQKVNSIRMIGLSYFILLSVVNLGATLWYGQLSALDFVLVCLALTPVLFKSKKVYLSLGVFGALVSLYMGVACLVFNLQPNTMTTQFSFNMGYLLSITSLTASSMLIYTGVHLIRSIKMEHA